MSDYYCRICEREIPHYGSYTSHMKIDHGVEV